MSSKVYTKTGDKGETSLASGTRVPKTHPRIEAYGTVDELNSWIGLVNAALPESCKTELQSILTQIQNQLFNLGSHLACEKAEWRSKMPPLKEEWVEHLEKDMDRREAHVGALTEFILPGGSEVSARLHIARTICRRAERNCILVDERSEEIEFVVIYLNRLSDFLFMAARHANHLEGHKDVAWSKE